MEVLGHSLEAVGIWMRANRLRLNPERTEALLFRKSSMQESSPCGFTGTGAQFGTAPGLAALPGEPGGSSGQGCICTASVGVPTVDVLESIKLDHDPCPSDFMIGLL